MNLQLAEEESLVNLYVANEDTIRAVVSALVATDDALLNPARARTTFDAARQRQLDGMAELQRLRERRRELRAAYETAFAARREAPRFFDTPHGAFDPRFESTVTSDLLLGRTMHAVEEALLNDEVAVELPRLSNAAVTTLVMRLTPAVMRAAIAADLVAPTNELITVAVGRGTLLLNDATIELPFEPGASVLIPNGTNRRWLVDGGLYGGGSLRLIVPHVPPVK